MKLLQVSLASSAFAVSFLQPSEAFKPGSGNAGQALQPAAFVESQEQAEAVAFIQAKLAEVNDDEAEQTEEEIMNALKPAISQLMKSLLQGVTPDVRNECKLIMKDLASQQDKEEEIEEDFSFSEQQQQQQQQQQQPRKSSGSFWDKVKKGLGRVAVFASPLIERAAKMIGPKIERLGEKFSPAFSKYLTKALRDACEEAEVEEGLKEA